MAKLVIKGNNETLDELFIRASCLTLEPEIILEEANPAIKANIDWLPGKDKIIIEGEVTELQKLKDKLLEHYRTEAQKIQEPLTCLEQAEISKA